MTSLQSTSSAAELVRSLAQHAAQLDLGRLHKFTDAGLEPDELREALHSLNSVADNYQDPSDMETA